MSSIFSDPHSLSDSEDDDDSSTIVPSVFSAAESPAASAPAPNRQNPLARRELRDPEALRLQAAGTPLVRSLRLSRTDSSRLQSLPVCLHLSLASRRLLSIADAMQVRTRQEALQNGYHDDSLRWERAQVAHDYYSASRRIELMTSYA